MSDPDAPIEVRSKQAGLQAKPKATAPDNPISVARSDSALDDRG